MDGEATQIGGGVGHGFWTGAGWPGVGLSGVSGIGQEAEVGAVEIEKLLRERRTLEKALADLLAKYQHDPSPELARTIELIHAEIELRKRKRPLKTFP